MEERMSGFCIAKARTHLRNSNNSTGNDQYGSGTKCGRWNPTTEQVKVLTELFRSGLRTPSTDQIQKISSQLSYYGKIESKNVFYWFQNHKARERQKRRRVVDDVNDVAVVLSSSSPASNLIRREDPFSSSARYFSEMSHNRQLVEYDNYEDAPAAKAERVIETLQLFPLNSFNDVAAADHHHHQYYYGRKEVAAAHHHHHHHRGRGISCGFSSEMDHPPLDLRLSFL